MKIIVFIKRKGKKGYIRSKETFSSWNKAEKWMENFNTEHFDRFKRTQNAFCYLAKE